MEIDPLVVISVAIVLLTIVFFAMRSGPAAKKRPTAKFLDKSRQTLTLGACPLRYTWLWLCALWPMKDARSGSTGSAISVCRVRAAVLAPRPACGRLPSCTSFGVRRSARHSSRRAALPAQASASTSRTTRSGSVSSSRMPRRCAAPCAAPTLAFCRCGFWFDFGFCFERSAGHMHTPACAFKRHRPHHADPAEQARCLPPRPGRRGLPVGTPISSSFFAFVLFSDLPADKPRLPPPSCPRPLPAFLCFPLLDGLPTPRAHQVLGLPVGKHFKLYAPNPKGSVEGEWNGRADPEVTKIRRQKYASGCNHPLSPTHTPPCLPIS